MQQGHCPTNHVRTPLLTIAQLKPVTISGLGHAPVVAVTAGAMGDEIWAPKIWVVLAQKEKAAVLRGVVLCQSLVSVMTPVQGASSRLLAALVGWTQLQVQAT